MTENTDNIILVVDDEEFLRRIVVRMLTANGYQCMQATGGAEALALLNTREYTLVISDIMMPGMSGLELLQVIRQKHPNVAVIMLTAVDEQETGMQALELGAYGYLFKPFEDNALLINVVNALRRRELEMRHHAHEELLEQEVRMRIQEIHRREEEITLRLVTASEYRHDETGTHIRRMAQYATLLARAIGWSAEQVDLLRLAAPIHDIGKIGIPDSILLKPGKLTSDEFALMKKHASIGAEMLKDSDIPLVQMASVVALSHHERWDGSGYPQGLAGEAIPESARIVALADVYDALHANRVYRPAFSEQQALAMMIESKNQFDPRLFDCMIEHIEEFRRIRQTFADNIM